MSYPDTPPVELLNQLAPDVKEYCLNKVNKYYRNKRDSETRANILHLISSGEPFYYTGPTGKTYVLRGAGDKDIETIKKYFN